MYLDFAAALRSDRIGGDAGIVRLANAARTPADYLLSTFLPDVNLPSYIAEDAGITVRTTMAGAVGMDSKYPEGGFVDMSTFREKIAKLALTVPLPEETLRQIQALAQVIRADGGSTTDIAVETILNFTQKLLLQAMWDRAEWLKGQALFLGAIDWTFNGSVVRADYGMPASNQFPTRMGTDAYDGSTSKFWADVRAARRVLRGRYEVSVADSQTVDAIVENPANSINVVESEGGRFVIQRFVGEPGGLRPASPDARERLVLVAYDREGEIRNPAAPGVTLKVPFVPVGSVGHFGRTDRSAELVPGLGSQEIDPENLLSLGYNHIGPTTEGGGRPGRWMRVYTPQDMPMQLRGDIASNELPVITNRNALVQTSTTLTQ